MTSRLLTVAAVLLAGVASAVEPAIGTPEVFASGVDGPEGIAFTKDGGLIVGSPAGRLVRYESDGSSAAFAFVGDAIAGVTELKDRRVLAASVPTGRVWQVDRDGTASVLAEGIAGPNFIVETKKRRRILVSASYSGEILDISDGTPKVVATGFGFANGLAIAKMGRQRYLFVADTVGSRVFRAPLAKDDTLGAAEVYATGLIVADGLAFDRRGNLLVVGGDTLFVVIAKTGEVRTLSTDPLLDWPANLAFGRKRSFGKKTLYLVNFGFPLGSGTTILSIPYNIRGAKLVR